MLCGGTADELRVTLTASSMCLLSWRPGLNRKKQTNIIVVRLMFMFCLLGDGVGVDCSAVDNALSGKYNESLQIDFAPPLSRRSRSVVFVPFFF